MDGAPHVDVRTGAQLEITNIAVLVVRSWIADSANRLDMAQVGSGQAVYFMDGVAVKGTWRKESTEDATRFFDSAGDPIAFSPGLIWVQVAPPGARLTY